ncbi:hypothetical protein ScPMuIL_009732 [Solemya velum]
MATCDDIVAGNRSEDSVTTEGAGICLRSPLMQTHEVEIFPSFAVSKHYTTVLLIAYMKGGSTFVGRILGSLPQSVYYYEPIMSLTTFGYISSNDETCNIITDKCGVTDGMTEKAIKIIDNIIHCNLSDVPRRHIHNLGFIPTCTSIKDISSKCTDERKNVCREQKFRVAKVLRLAMDTVGLIMESQPSVKVIHLLRDSRKILVSRMTHMVRSSLFKTFILNASRSLCDKIYKDISIARVLEKKYPSRFKAISYESLVRDPKAKITELYSFVGYSATEKELDRISRRTRNTSVVNVHGKLPRQNWKSASEIWKGLIDHNTELLIKTYCSASIDIMKEYGYEA